MSTSRGPCTRSGFTLIEVLIVATLGVLILTALTIVFSGGRKMNKAAQLTVAIHGALLIQEQLAADMKQMGVRPGIMGPIKYGPRSLAFYRTVFQGNQTLLRPMRYVLERSRGGNYYLVRQEFRNSVLTEERALRDVVIQSLQFKELVGPLGEGRFLIVTLTTLDDDLPPSQIGGRYGGRKFSSLFLNKYQIPSLLGAATLSTSTNLLVEGDLPPTP